MNTLVLTDLIKFNIDNSNVDTINAIKHVQSILEKAIVKMQRECRCVFVSTSVITEVQVDMNGFFARMGDARLTAGVTRMGNVISPSIHLTEKTLSINLAEFLTDDDLQAIESLHKLFE